MFRPIHLDISAYGDHLIVVERDITGAIRSIRMIRASDFHAHFRQGNVMRAVTGPQTGPYRYLLAMPNNGVSGRPVIASIKDMLTYREELYELTRAGGSKADFVMTIYLTNETTPAVIEQMAGLASEGIPCAVKYYPPHKGATTNSGHGITLRQAMATGTLRAMEDYGVRLLGHFESVEDKAGRELPHPERAGYFMEHEFPWLRDALTGLKICIEHASVRAAYQHVLDDLSGNTVCTVTPQHLLFTSHTLRTVSWRNHLKCMPIVQGPEHVAMALECCTSGDFRFIAGTDTAPHASRLKTGSFDVCASGCYTPHALALYAMAFEKAGAMDHRLARFCSLNGPAWWGLKPPKLDDQIILRRPDVGDGMPDPTEVPEENDCVIPLGLSYDVDRLRVALRCD